MKRTLFALSLLVPAVSYANKFDIYVMGGPGFSAISNNSYVRMNQYMVWLMLNI
jgi:hypothetical protein